MSRGKVQRLRFYYPIELSKGSAVCLFFNKYGDLMRSKLVLIIEDDQVLRESTSMFLKEEGYEVLTAKNGLEGVEKAMEHIPDLILCDISMPRMNGYEVYSIISQNSATSFIPFIYLSAKTEREDIRVGMQMGADDYITKPFDYDELLKAIELRIAKREKLINATESGFKAILDSTLTGIMIYQDERVTFTNSKLIKIFGYSQDEFLKINFFDLVHNEYRTELESKVRRCVRGIQRSFNTTFKASTKSNECVNIDCWGGLSTINGGNALIANLINIDEYRKRAESQHTGAVNIYLNEKTERISNDEPVTFNEPQNPHGLTGRELEVLQLICKGLTNHEIADKLFLSVRTVDTHRGNLLGKTGVSNTAGLVVYAIKHNLFSVED